MESLVDSDIAQMNLSYYDSINIGLRVGFAQRSSWAVDQRDQWLADSINEWAASVNAQEYSKQALKHYFEMNRGPKPDSIKVDTRAAIFCDGKILLVRERSGKWSMPGGWCDYDMSPAESTVKEAKEEAGLDVVIDRLIAVQDREKHNEPAYVYKVVKIFYLCHAVGGSFTSNIETSDSRYFSEEEIPPLADEKCNEEQVIMCFQAYRNSEWKVQFD